eukprot:12562873-Ditylum_brightwellii.AAC.1
MELVADSQIVDKLDSTIDSSHTTTVKEDLNRTSIGPSTDECLDFIRDLNVFAVYSQQHIEDDILQYDVQA